MPLSAEVKLQQGIEEEETAPQDEEDESGGEEDPEEVINKIMKKRGTFYHIQCLHSFFSGFCVTCLFL